jgi:hypothetical protein
VSFNVSDSDQSSLINTGNQRDKLEFLSAGYEFNENSVASESLNMGGFRGGEFIYRFFEELQPMKPIDKIKNVNR